MNTEQLIVALLAILIGGGILWYAGTAMRSASDRRNWSQTKGEIISSEIKRIEGGDGPIYFPSVHYRYRVNSVEHESNVVTLSFPPHAESQGYAKTVAGKYQPRQIVEVYYNPNNASDAVLERNVSSSGMFLLLILGIPTFLCGLILLLGFLAQAGIF